MGLWWPEDGWCHAAAGRSVPAGIAGSTTGADLRVLLTGATGLIGRAVLAGLAGEGHDVVAIARGAGASQLLPQAARCIALDIAQATEPVQWLPHLVGIDAVVNCAGVLQDGPRDSTAGVHTRGPAALFAACEQAGVRRVVQMSAVGVDRDSAVTAFARSKRAGDEALMARDLEWVVLRPSVVVGRQAYGGSALFRGLAALPLVPRVRDTGPMQIVQLDDLVRTVLFFLRADAPTRVALEIVGPEALSLDEVLAAYRRWLGFGQPALRVRAALGGGHGVSDRRPHRPSRLAPAAQIHHPGRDRTRRDRRSGSLAAPHRHDAAHARRGARNRARVRAGAPVRAALFPQACGAGHAIALLDRLGPHRRWVRAGRKGST